jgi:hypothetical protein
MAKSTNPPTVDPWPAEGLLIDAACRSIMPDLWDAYTQARAAAPNLAELREAAHNASKRRAKLCLKSRPDAQRWFDAWIALDTQLRRCLEEGKFELWGRPGNPLAQPERIPRSALQWLRFYNFEERTAEGEGLKLFDVRLRRDEILSLPAVKILPLPAAEWLAAAAARLDAAPDRPKEITTTARRLEQEMAEAFKRRECDAALAWGTIKNNLLNWGLRPRTRPSKS